VGRVLADAPTRKRAAFMKGCARLIGALIATASLPFSSPRSDEPAVWWVAGIGNDSCGKFLASIEELPTGRGKTLHYPDGNTYYSDSFAYAAWIQGYISGVNAYERQRPIKVDYAGTELWIKKWCEAHPADTLVSAVGHFIASRWTAPGKE
jgi:hypothetical protein